jgi:methylthioribose-1-phosphate isomerase
MQLEHIKFDLQKKTLTVLDQRLLPEKEFFLELKTYEEVADAIKNLTVRGAPLIGVTAAYGMVIGGYQYYRKKERPDWEKIKTVLSRTRPTAVNLFWALSEMEELRKKLEKAGIPLSEILFELEKKALQIHEDDFSNNQKMGEFGSVLLHGKKNILTHCNAGWLATGGWGTAVGVIFSYFKKNSDIHIWVDETRPVLQGSRLTAYELLKMGVSHTVICDNMAGMLMGQGRVDAVIVGADRITQNGDVANKIGSYSLAVLASYHKVPFYVAAPFSTIDANIKSGRDIPIEERSEDEIKQGMGRLTVPLESPVYNPAFDVIPEELVTAIVTEKGVYFPPYNFRK